MRRLLLLLLLLTLLVAGCAPLPPLMQPLEPPTIATPVPPAAAGDSDAPAPAPTRAPLAPADPLPPDPAVRTGTLSNGLTYYVRENGEPARRAELWLVIDAGSVLEEADQLGLAHFLEHMLFNGTERFEGTELIAFLETLGMEFGPDVNAYTSFDETVYTLQVPTDDPAIVAAAFDVLEDWSAHATLSPEEIDKERGVVVEEWRLRDQNADGRMFEQIWPVLVGESRYAERLPIGDMAIVRNAPPDAIRRFYENWYRPDLMAIIAVGDFDADAIEAQIVDRFGRLPLPANPAERPTFPVPGHEETRYLVIVDPENPATTVSIDHKRRPLPFSTVADLRGLLASLLFDGMLNSRFAEVSRQADAPFLAAYAGTSALVRPLDSYTLEARVELGRSLAGLEALLTEVERVRRYGFTETELDRAKTGLLRSMEITYNERENIDSSLYADDYRSHFLTGAAIPSVDLLNELVQTLVPTITLAEVNDLAADFVDPADRVIIVTAPETDSARPPSETRLAAVVEAVQAAEIEPYVDLAADGQLMTRRLEPATVVAEQAIPELGVTIIELANGVRVVMKPTDFRQDQVLMSARSPGGSSLVDDADFAEASSISHVVSGSGIGQFDLTALEKLLNDKAVAVSPFIAELAEGFSGVASPQDLETLFQLVHLYATEPRADETAFEVFKDQQREWLANRIVSPVDSFVDVMFDALYGKTIRRGPLPLEEIESLDLARGFEIYQERFGDFGDFTFVFVGNFDETALRSLAQTYLGTLPAAGRRESWRDVAPAPPEGVVERVLYKGQEEQAMVQLFFSGPFDGSEAESMRLMGLRALLDIFLREELREARSGIYFANVTAGTVLEPRPEYTLGIWFGTDPERVDEMVAAVFEQIDRLATDGPGSTDVAKVQEQMRRDREEALEQNSFWLSELEHYLTTPGLDAKNILEFDGLLQTLTPADIQAAAQRYLSPDRFVKVILYPEAYKEGAGEN